MQDGRRHTATYLVAAGVFIAALLALAGCDQFSAEGVAQRCVVSALKAGEPYGNDQERRKTEEQLRQYCRSAAGAK